MFCETVAIYMHCRYNKTMIKTFADKETEKIYNQIFSKKLPQSIQCKFRSNGTLIPITLACEFRNKRHGFPLLAA